jgi:hypothetical protein
VEFTYSIYFLGTTMTDVIRLKRSLTPGAIPTTASLVEGELALNIADKQLYIVSGSEVVSLNDTSTLNTGSFQATQLDIVTDHSVFTITGSTLLNVFDETALITPFVSAIDFSGATIDYNIQRPGASRFGTVMASWSGSQIVYSDNSTSDIGETWDLSFNLVRVDDEIRLRVYSLGSGSGGWSISSVITLFPNLL